jgi:hypothetical protein
MAPPSDLPQPTVSASLATKPPSTNQHPHSLQVSTDATVSLTWKSAHATKAQLEPGGPLKAEGTTELPAKDADYTLTALNDAGDASAPFYFSVHTHRPDQVVSTHAVVKGEHVPLLSEVPEAAPAGALKSILQPWNHKRMYLWWLDAAVGKTPVPLVIYLHGLIFPGHYQGDGQLLAPPALMKKEKMASNVGCAVSAQMARGQVKPLVIAAPASSASGPWANFDFSAHVQLAIKGAAEAGITIALDQVSVVGWSAAGGNPDGGLMKIGTEGGRFKTADNVKYALKVIGITDCKQDDARLSSGLQRALAKANNDTTIIYSVQKDHGGWAAPGYVDASKVQPFADGFGKLVDYRPFPASASAGERADEAAFDFFQVDDRDNPKRLVARIRDGGDDVKGQPKQKPGLYHHSRELHDAQAIWHEDVDRHPDVAPDELPAAGRPDRHGMMPVVWTWYALPRFYKP